MYFSPSTVFLGLTFLSALTNAIVLPRQNFPPEGSVGCQDRDGNNICFDRNGDPKPEAIAAGLVLADGTIVSGSGSNSRGGSRAGGNSRTGGGGSNAAPSQSFPPEGSVGCQDRDGNNICFDRNGDPKPEAIAAGLVLADGTIVSGPGSRL